jgi:hypothetical protein
MPSPYKIKNKPANRTSSKKWGLLWTTLLAIGVGAFIYSFIHQPAPVKKSKPVSLTYRADDLGKNIQDLRQSYPELTLGRSLHGLTVATYPIEKAFYTAWFINNGKTEKVFRIRARTNETPYQTEMILKQLGQVYSRPIDVTCTQNSASQVQKCHYQWWIRKSVKLELFIQPMGDDLNRMSAVTTDTYLSTKHITDISAFIPSP